MSDGGSCPSGPPGEDRGAPHGEGGRPAGGRIVVVGSINMDLVVRCHEMPQPGQTLTGHDLREMHGGKGANQAVAAARLGADVEMIGRVGDDAFASRLLDGLRQHGVGVRAVRRTPGISSGIAIIHVDDSGENAITIVAGANGRLTPDDIGEGPASIANADLVLLQLEIPTDTVLAVIDRCRRHGTPVMLDPAPAPPKPFPALFRVDYLCPNEDEAVRLTGRPIDSDASAIAAARRLVELGAGHVLLTRGRHGVVAADRQGRAETLPAPRVRAVDTTAAGDAFAGAFAARLVRGDDWLDAASFAVNAGAHAATIPGAQPAMPDEQAVDRLRLQNL